MTEEDLNRTMKSCGGSIQTTVHDLNDTTLGQCALFEEKQVRLSRCLYISSPKYLDLNISIYILHSMIIMFLMFDIGWW